jgi:DNA-binding MarR family transcriptional regulator
MDATPWLDEDEQRVWRAFLSANRRVMVEIDRQLHRDSDMPHGYYEIMVRLSEAPERTLRMSELAASTLASRSRVSHAVARLQEQGWVERRECPSDRRGQLATLTDAGFAALAAAAPGHVETVRTLVFDALSPAQVRQLEEISRRLLDHADRAQEGRD